MKYSISLLLEFDTKQLSFQTRENVEFFVLLGV